MIPGASDPVSARIQAIEDRLKALEAPQSPTRAYTNQTATTAAQLPAASLYPFCTIWLDALATFAVSNGTNWIRQDTQGALA